MILDDLAKLLDCLKPVWSFDCSCFLPQMSFCQCSQISAITGQYNFVMADRNGGQIYENVTNSKA